MAVLDRFYCTCNTLSIVFCSAHKIQILTSKSASRSTAFKNGYRASDFYQDWWAEVTHGAKNVGSFSLMIGPSS